MAPEDILAALAHAPQAVRVVIAEAKGSVPREVGAAMIVWDSGQSGTIGGGALEWDAARLAREMKGAVGAKVLRVPLGPALGQCCGGAVTLVFEVFDEACARALDGPFHLRRVEGTAEQPLSVKRALGVQRNAGVPVPVIFENGWLLEPVAATKRPLWIYGAGHVGRALVSVLAPLPDLAITWVDTAADRFPEDIPENVTQLIASDPARAVKHAPENAEHLILTYSHALDLDLCHAILSHGFAKAGLIGSRTKWARFRARLHALGHSDAQISRIRCPIGQKSLGKHPQAIAVGVAADLISDSQTTEEREGATG